MILIINTAGEEKIKVILVKGENDFFVKEISAGRKHSEKLLVLVDRVLKERGIKFNTINSLGVVNGPGRFTSLRIGIAVANTLAYSFKVPVVSVRLDEFKGNCELVSKVIKKIKLVKIGKFDLSKNIILPHYGSEPNIG